MFNAFKSETMSLTSLKSDFPAALVVFLISIPLSLGIALASGAPFFSGLIASIIGGLIVAPLSQSALGISGTSAGIAVLVFFAIDELGFNNFLLALVIAGLFQIGLGILRAGVIAYYFPSSVINGLLSGIGLILFLKQIPHAVGYDRDYEGDFGFFQVDHYSSFSELIHAVQYISPTACVIALISLTILIGWEYLIFKKQPYIKLYQGILLTVIFGIVSNQFLQGYFPELALKSGHLVTLSGIENIDDLLKQFHLPNFAAWNDPQIYFTALTLALVASLETLVCVEAVDKLDPYKGFTSTNRELVVQGVANLSSGLIGGLPLTQVIVRSSVNIQAGATTKLSGIIQGFLILLTVVFVPHALNQIPLATLACILLVVSYKLINPRSFIAIYRTGYYHFVPFGVTVLGLVLTDILMGLCIGLSVALFTILLENYKSATYFRESVTGNKVFFRLSEYVSFLNKANIKLTLESVPKDTEVVIDATRTKFLDYDVYEIIEDFKNEAALRNIKLMLQNVRGFGVLPPVETVKPYTLDSQKSLTPQQVLKILQEGNEQFVNNLQANRNFLEQINDTQQGQFPIAIILSCMDSRTSVELIFNQGLGDVFSVRIAGNVVNDDILGSMEYACKVAGSKLIVVLGHSHCGAIKGACAQVQLSHLTGLLEKIQPSVQYIDSQRNYDAELRVQKVAEHNVLLTVQEIKNRSAVLNEMLAAGEIGLVGGMYDIETGRVHFFEQNQ